MSLKVAHVITGLAVGGAERMLCNLVKAWSPGDVDSAVICLGPEDALSEELMANGASVTHLGLGSIWRFPFALRSISKIIAAYRANLVQGWMYHGNLAAQLARRPAHTPVAWNVRQSLHRPDLFKATTRLTIRANARLSRRPQSIIYNSRAARHQHEAIGFRPDRGICIPNGVEIDRFAPAPGTREETRRQWGLSDENLVAIAVGRAHPIKGHRFLMDAVAPTVAALPNVRFVIVGRGASWDAAPFSAYADNALVRNATILIGERSDVPCLLAAADVFVSSSETEGFPNAVAEAMATGLPCVVTDVGDSAFLLGGCGQVVEPGDAAALSAALTRVLGLLPEARLELGRSARERVEAEFSLAHIATLYRDHYRQLVVSAAPAVSH